MILFNPHSYSLRKGVASPFERWGNWDSKWELAHCHPTENLTHDACYQIVPVGTLPPPQSQSLAPNTIFPEEACSPRSWPSQAATLQVLKCCWAPRHTPCKAAARGGGTRSLPRVIVGWVRRPKRLFQAGPVLECPTAPVESLVLPTTKYAAAAMARTWLSPCLEPIAPNPFQCIYFPVPGQGLWSANKDVTQPLCGWAHRSWAPRSPLQSFLPEASCLRSL